VPNPNCTGEEMALHKIIEYASDFAEDEEECQIDDYYALPVHLEDDNFNDMREHLFEDHDVLMLFNKSTEKFMLGQVNVPGTLHQLQAHSYTSFIIQHTSPLTVRFPAYASLTTKSKAPRVYPYSQELHVAQVIPCDVCSRCHLLGLQLPEGSPQHEQAAADTMAVGNLHPSAWFLAFRPSRAADHVHSPPATATAHPRRAGLRPLARRETPARAPAEEEAPRRRRAAVAEERASSPEEPAPKRRRGAAAPARAARR
jgi:hypothetical protein